MRVSKVECAFLLKNTFLLQSAYIKSGFLTSFPVGREVAASAEFSKGYLYHLMTSMSGIHKQAKNKLKIDNLLIFKDCHKK